MRAVVETLIQTGSSFPGHANLSAVQPRGRIAESGRGHTSPIGQSRPAFDGRSDVRCRAVLRRKADSYGRYRHRPDRRRLVEQAPAMPEADDVRLVPRATQPTWRSPAALFACVQGVAAVGFGRRVCPRKPRSSEGVVAIIAIPATDRQPETRKYSGKARGLDAVCFKSRIHGDFAFAGVGAWLIVER